MYYTKIQKFLSGFIIFSILFSITFRIPIFNFSAFAGNSEFYNLVSIIVDEDSYDEIKTELKRYSKDIQGVLENTKVVILPTPKNTSAFNIASLNESLYFDGYSGIDDVDFESKLIGTILVGDIDLPIIYKNGDSSKTILPYTDFEDKLYIYNNKTNRYEKNTNNADGLKSEIWHGVISPNFGNNDLDIQGLKDYFDKNHDFYQGTGNFKLSDGILNGNKNESVSSSYDPYVFYFDSFREEKSISYESFMGYEGYLENKEDIVYNRFSKELADRLTEKTVGKAGEEISNLFSKISSETLDLSSSAPSTNNVPDIQTRHITQNVTKKFIEIFSKGTIGDFRKDVHNAGRYNEPGSKVNVDFIPYIVSTLDIINDQLLKEINSELENEIDNLVKNGLSRYIAIPTTVLDKGANACNDTYTNYLYGTKGSDITSADSCSIYRGSTYNSGTLVEANRGLNITKIEGDVNTLKNESAVSCLSSIGSGENQRINPVNFNGYWGGNTGLNLNKEKSLEGIIELDSNRDLKGSIVPLFDIRGSKKVFDNSKVNSPLNCYENNYILSRDNNWKAVNTYTLPSCVNDYEIGNPGTSWSCKVDNNSSSKTFSFDSSFEDNYKTLSAGRCEKNSIKLDGTNIKNKNYTQTCSFLDGINGGGINCCNGINTFVNPDGSTGNSTFNSWGGYNYSYKKIDSYIVHKSPTGLELKEQIDAGFTQTLPVDKNRYIDFIGAKGDYTKIDYPYLFRLNIEDSMDFSIDSMSLSLDNLLNEKSDEINNVIRNSNPSTLAGQDLEIYNYLKKTNHPSDNFNLVSFLKDKPDKTFTIDGETKIISYYDSLVFALYWNNLTSSSSKYSFIFENYLSDQFADTDSQYFLPKNKKQYEISYLGAPGDTKNMYIKVSPEAKAPNPYANIISDNIKLSSALLGLNIGGANSGEDKFKCSPPDGVPIWEWMPAVMCWLKGLLPPEISISDGVCGYSLLSEDEAEELKSCNGDIDKNGVNDCIENKLKDGILELASDSTKYYYNKNASLTAVIKDKDGNKLRFVNGTDINFELIRVEAPINEAIPFNTENIDLIYDINDIYKSDLGLIDDYLVFSDGKIQTVGGESKNQVSLKSKDVNIFFRAFIEVNDDSDNNVIFLESNELKIEVRGDRLFTTNYKIQELDFEIETTSGSDTLLVSDDYNIYLADANLVNISNTAESIYNSSSSKEKTVLYLENIAKGGYNVALDYPLNIKLFNNDKIENEIIIYSGDLSNYKKLFSLKKSGEYKIEIKDSTGFSSIKNIQLIPDIPNSVDINLGTSIMESDGNISTNFVTLYDKYLNPSFGDFYNLEFNIDGDSIKFLENDSKSISYNTFEGYKVFRLQSTDDIGTNTINIDVFNYLGEKLTSGSKDIRVLDSINFVTTPLSGSMTVGGGEYSYEISLRNDDGTIIDDFNSRVYLIADSIFLEASESYFNLVNGKAKVTFKTKTLAGKDIPIEFQVEGLNKIVKKEIDILPGKAMKMDLILSNNKIEASEVSSSTLTVELKDRYNNLVFNDNSTETRLEIKNDFSHIINSDSYVKTTSGGVSTFKIYGTVNPGVAYFKISTDPSLSVNSFLIEDESGELVINGVGENAGKIETFYFWNQEKLNNTNYNSLYTTLLGSSYGDITEQNYLAGSLLFDKDNRSISVTSLLNNPYDYNNVLNINPNGGIEPVYSEGDLSQDIRLSTYFLDNKLALNLFNNSLNIHIGNVFYNFADNTKLDICEGEIVDCISKSETSIVLKSFSNKYTGYSFDDKILLRDIYGKKLFDISDNGTISRYGSVEFEYLESNNNYALFNIKTGGEIIGALGFNFINPIISISQNESIFKSKIDNVDNSVLVLLKTNNYGVYNSGNKKDLIKTIYYKDPFASNNSLNDFSKESYDGYEAFVEEGGIGWKDGNKSLLAFSSGKSVGESVKDYMSFSVINLGDPVLNLKKIKKKIPGTNIDRQFDSTIGKLLSQDQDIVGYSIFDYDADDKEDILLIKNNNYLKLLENKDISNDFIDKGNLATIVDLGNKNLIKTGDFTGDNFDDIFFVNDEGKPFLLNNVDKDFLRYPLISHFELSGRIIKVEVFDMDNDSIDDIVTLDDAGEINILYGNGGDFNNPTFTKLKVSENHGIKLNGNKRNDNSLIYFDGLYQPQLLGQNDDILEENKNYLAKLSADPDTVPTTNNDDLINNLIFVRVPYDTRNIVIDSEKLLDPDFEIPTEKESKYFIKGEYSEFTGLKVEKIFRDNNGGFLSTGDIIDVEIVITNTSSSTIKKMAYLEKVPEIFKLRTSSISNNKDLQISDGNLGYHFMFSGFELNPNEEFTISYEVEVLPIKYGFLEVGLFEKGELGNDNFGDIIFKKNNENCSLPVDIFRSEGARLYNKGKKVPTCDENKIKLPEELEKNTIDIDNNGIPDYIDELTDTSESNRGNLQDYSNGVLAELNADDDGDGLPNAEDFFNGEASILIDGNLLIGEETTKKIEEGLGELDDILNGLSCGFGNASCFATPLNWAPLAPGNDPVFMGVPIGDGFRVGEGIPVLSGLTGMSGPFCAPIPTIWPMSPMSFPGGFCGGQLGAGGLLGTTSPTNFFRIFVTPTLTGGVGTAICFGGPAEIVGNSLPMGLSPLVPGGNCIVIAKPLSLCSGDGSDGDVASIGNPIYSGNGSFGIINGNCSGDNSVQEALNPNSASDYLESKNDPVGNLFEFLPGDFSEDYKTPSLTQGSEGDISVTLDLSSIQGGEFSDILQVQMPRISPFPQWLNGWVTRQIEEIANKLTDFPTIFVILPDFSGIFDGNWSKNSGNSDNFSADEENGDYGSISVNDELLNSTGAIAGSIKSGAEGVNSGIKEVYDFIGSTPLVSIKETSIDIDLPWFSQSELNRTISSREKTLGQWEQEVIRAKEAWSFAYACDYPEGSEKQKLCTEENELSSKVGLDNLLEINALVSSLRKNLEVIKSYKKLPEDISTLINKKEDYLEQVLCNVEAISGILGGRIGKNGKIFKTWVELYILIKAILKSWQLLVDIFIDYGAECSECKNERGNALDFQFKLIDAIIPKIPIIIFPKWPDIIIDLHNIRAGLTIDLPTFNINTRPLLLPSFPNLYLPDVPSIDLSFDLPALPILAEISIPELPDLPSLPTVNLPDLPPPPKLPKMFASLTGVLDILKLITKAMCILKSSPLHPEWRAGDQIAFLTERNGYLSFDFLFPSMPEFSFPFLDAVKVTSYVNLEFETEFIVELAERIVLPINTLGNDYTSIFSIDPGALDFRDVLQDEGAYNLDKGELNLLFAKNISKNYINLVNYIKENKEEVVTNKEFRQLINESLASTEITSNPRFDELRKVWSEVDRYTYSKEDKLIIELQKNNREKFEVVSDILNTEIIKNKELKKKINNLGKESFINKVSYEKSEIDLYNKTLEKYNDKFINSAKKLINPDSFIEDDLKKSKTNLLSSIKTPLSNYKNPLNNKVSKLLSATSTVASYSSTAVNSCQAQANSDYKYNYKGIYVVENNKSYRLSDYLDELNGNEEIKLKDIDNDGDEDILYFMNGQLFLKENLQKNPTKSYLSDGPIVLNSDSNKFYNGDIFYESINNPKEIGNDISNINISFIAPTNNSINNFRLGFYTRVDKFLNEYSSIYRPEFIKKSIIDAISGIGEINIIDSDEFLITRKNISYINAIGNVKGVKLKTKNLIDIKDDLSNNKIVNLSKGTVLYAGGNSFTVIYKQEGSDDIKTLKINRHENIEFLMSVKISGITGNAYIKGFSDIILKGEEIREHLGKPLFAKSNISYEGNNYELLDESYIEIMYYDDSELFINFDDILDWELYDLGDKSDKYSIRSSRKNDFYYAKIASFKDNILSTNSNQILLSPQIEADENAPELSMPGIRIPVYQKKIIDLTDYVYEDTGITGIGQVIVDFDLELDTDSNGNKKDDDDGNLEGLYKDKVIVLNSPISLKLEFGDFDTLFKRKIGITLIDDNGNDSYSEVDFEVYSPVPQITNFSNGIISGTLNEDLTNEPVNLYKYRGGVVTKLENTDGTTFSNTNIGDYNFNISNEGAGLSLYKLNTEIAFISEKTGKIFLKAPTLIIKALSSNHYLNDTAYPKIIISDGGDDIFYENVQVNGINKVEIVDSFDGLIEKGIYFKFNNKANYNFYSIPETLKYNPGSLGIYRNTDINKEALFTLFKDGRINTINTNYGLKYSDFGDYIVLKLIDKHFNREVGEVLFIVDSEYIMK